MMAMVTLRARLQTWLSRAQRIARKGRKSRQERNTYYDILEHTQKGIMDITSDRVVRGCLGRPINATLSAILAKARFCDRIKDVTLNEPTECRQPFAVRVRRQAHDLQIRNACQVLTGQSLSDIQETDRAWRPGSESWREAHRKLFTRSIAITTQRLRKGSSPEGREPARGRGEA